MFNFKIKTMDPIKDKILLKPEPFSAFVMNPHLYCFPGLSDKAREELCAKICKLQFEYLKTCSDAENKMYHEIEKLIFPKKPPVKEKRNKK